MKFRTEIEILPTTGNSPTTTACWRSAQCFATEIGRRMAEAKFRIAVNPSGVLFNPLSIVRTLRRYRDGRPLRRRSCSTPTEGGSTTISTVRWRAPRRTKR